MGQAKKRGTREERVEQALQRVEQARGEERNAPIVVFKPRALGHTALITSMLALTRR